MSDTPTSTLQGKTEHVFTVESRVSPFFETEQKKHSLLKR